MGNGSSDGRGVLILAAICLLLSVGIIQVAKHLGEAAIQESAHATAIAQASAATQTAAAIPPAPIPTIANIWLSTQQRSVAGAPFTILATAGSFPIGTFTVYWNVVNDASIPRGNSTASGRCIGSEGVNCFAPSNATPGWNTLILRDSTGAQKTIPIYIMKS